MSADSDSPCRKICTLAADRSHCTACHRTLDEIARWARMTPAERQAVLDALPSRAAEGAAPPA